MIPGELSDLICVGGSTWIPSILQTVKELTRKISDFLLDPDEVVALGASL